MNKIKQCEHMLLYLDAQTWTRREGSAVLATEVSEAMDAGVHILLAHEMPSSCGQSTHFGCEFGAFFSHPDGSTPAGLLKRGIYSEIAVPLKGGPWREASMALLASALMLSACVGRCTWETCTSSRRQVSS